MIRCTTTYEVNQASQRFAVVMVKAASYPIWERCLRQGHGRRWLPNSAKKITTRYLAEWQAQRKLISCNDWSSDLGRCQNRYSGGESLQHISACRPWAEYPGLQMQNMAGRPNALGQQTRCCRPNPASWGSRYTIWFCPGTCSTNNMPPFIFGFTPFQGCWWLVHSLAWWGNKATTKLTKNHRAHRWNNNKTNSKNTRVSSDMLKTWKFHLYVGCCQQLEDWHLNWV